MRLPVRNYTSTVLTLFIEPDCDQYEIPPQGEAMVTLDDGGAHSLEIHPENWVSLFNEGASDADVEIITKEQNTVVDAVLFVRCWLHQYGPEGLDAVKDLDSAIEREETTGGYLRARFNAYQALRKGFHTKAAEVQPESAALTDWRGTENLAGAYRAGGVAAYANYRTRLDPTLVELGKAPFDTDVAKRKFAEADAIMG